MDEIKPVAYIGTNPKTGETLIREAPVPESVLRDFNMRPLYDSAALEQASKDFDKLLESANRANMLLQSANAAMLSGVALHRGRTDPGNPADTCDCKSCLWIQSYNVYRIHRAIKDQP